MPKLERNILAHLAVQALPAISARTLAHLSDDVFRFTDRIGEHLGISFPPVDDSLDADTRKDLLRRVEQFRAALPPKRIGGLDKRIEWLSRVVGLSVVDKQILGHLVRAQLYEPYCQLLQYYNDGPRSPGEVHIEALAALLNRSPLNIIRRLEPGAPLNDAGLVRDCRGGDWAATNLVLRVARMSTTKSESLAAGLLGNSVATSLAWSDFAHLGELAELGRKLVSEAAHRRRGVNILLYGVPGTGKSQFAAALAKACGLNGILVGATDEDGREPDRSERLGHLAVCRALVARSSQHMLIVDEAEDLMIQPSFMSSNSSKLYLNRLVERSTVPTIWIINDQNLMGGPVIRRMSLAIEFRLPGLPIRRKLAERITASEGVAFDQAAIERLAELNVAPAVVQHAVRAAAWSGGGVDHALLAATSVARALGRKEAAPVIRSAAEFDPSLSEADTDLEGLAKQIISSESLEWSLLAFGPPGTGKSAFARHLADRMGIPVVEKRASDLLNMYVGTTEKAIASAFREAADSEAMLIIDEADSLLRDRSLAQRSWEVSMTNEMLTWMERSPVPFVATTNLQVSLDPATARRFLFKVEMKALDSIRARKLFQHVLGVAAPAELDSISDLTPGDFALVARKAAILSERRPSQLLRMLADEAAAKPGAAKAKLGFG